MMRSIPSFLIFAAFANASPFHSLKSRAVDIAGYDYAGCFTEATLGRALAGKTYIDDLMTTEKCAAACVGFTWFGTEYGRECYCGQSLSGGSSKAAEISCSYSCKGDSSQVCGGESRLTTYALKGTTTPYVASAVAYQSLGCYVEPFRVRALRGGMYADDALTVERCQAKCDGFTYFGLEFGRECYCGNALTDGTIKALETDCNYACRGNRLQSCGGSLRLNLYSSGDGSGLPAPAPPAPPVTTYTRQGCYTDVVAARALTGRNYFGDDVTIEKCGSICVGYSYFGLEYGRECYCGNVINNSGQLTADAECKFSCAGDSTEKCGAGNRLDLYKFAVLAQSTSTTTSTTTISSTTSTTSSTTSSTTTDALTTSSTTTSSDVSSTTFPASSTTSSTTSSATTTTTSSTTTSDTSSTTSDIPSTSSSSTGSTTESPTTSSSTSDSSTTAAATTSSTSDSTSTTSSESTTSTTSSTTSESISTTTSSTTTDSTTTTTTTSSTTSDSTSSATSSTTPGSATITTTSSTSTTTTESTTTTTSESTTTSDAASPTTTSTTSTTTTITTTFSSASSTPTACGQPTNGNLLVNPSFEDNIGTPVQSWMVTDPNTIGNFLASDQISLCGSNALIYRTSGGIAARIEQRLLNNITKGKQYNISAYVNRAGLSTGFCRFYTYTTDQDFEGLLSLSTMINGGGWQEVSGVYTATQDNMVLQLIAFCQRQEDVFIDQIVVEPVNV